MFGTRSALAVKLLGTCVAFIILASACAGGDSSGRDESISQAIANVDVIVCPRLPTDPPEDPIMTPRPADRDLPEWFNLNAFNATLQSYPDFAKRAGLQRVNNCQTARRAATAYLKYSAQFPGFDRDVVVPQSERRLYPLEPGEPVAEADPAAEPPMIEKIKNGTNSGLRPVVTIEGVRVLPGGSGVINSFCTASFISRNWIATAGHCLMAEDPAHPTADIHNSRDLFGGNGNVFDPNSSTLKLNGRLVTYFITFYNDDGTPFVSQFALPPDHTKFRYVTAQYLNPLYKGFFGQRTFEDDFGLLYISSADDNRLAANPDPPPGLQAPWLRILQAGGGGSPSGAPTQQGFFWGSGDTGGNDLGNFLQRVPLTNTSNFIAAGTHIEFTTSTFGPQVCEGDSGGPFVDQFTLVPAFGGPAPVQAIVGALSGYSNAPSTCPQSDICACQAGAQVVITPMDRLETFINETLQINYVPTGKSGNKFFCKTEIANEGTLLRCWGNKCQTSGDCPAGESCVHPGSSLKNCIGQCSTPTGCDCIFGMCRP